MTPRRVESSLLVLEQFTDPGGTEWRPGDRAPLARAAIRRAAKERPELFVVEYETLPFDPNDSWFREVDAAYEEQYQRLKAHRDGEAARREAALRAELAEQERGQPELLRRYKQQEKERAKREKAAKAKHERRILENEMEFMSGFHVKR